jgi:tRNA A-37 threonylcarbamoyl transferase component Bud32
MIGQSVAHYRVVEHLGSGGMGEVYVAEDTRLQRRVALKFLPSALSYDDEFRARFVREARSIAAINHPNIIHIYEVSQHEGLPYFAMELVEGGSLRDRIVSGGMPLEETLRVAGQICAGLAAAHRAGVIHRDIKPANILLDAHGNVKILDFGLAKRPADAEITAVGLIPGTVSYMSPEQAGGQTLDHRTDIFSVGVVLYELLSGRQPFARDSDLLTISAIANDPVPALPNNIPSDLAAIVERMLCKDVTQRYQQISEPFEALRRCAAGLAVGEPIRLEPKATGGRAIWITSAAILAFGAAAIAFYLSQGARTSGDVPAGMTQDTSSDQSALTAPEQMPSRPDSTTIAESHSVPIQPDPQLEEAALQLRDRVIDARSRVDQDDMGLEPYKRGLSDEAAGDSLRHIHEWTQAGSRYRRALTLFGDASDSGRHKDSTDVTELIDQFWQSLSRRDVAALSAGYPSMPKEQQSMWQQFTEQTKDLIVTSTFDEIALDDREAKARVAVRMSFRDAGGQRSETVRYDIELSETDGIWSIRNMTQQR